MDIQPATTQPPSPEAELGRLAELMPASGRMWCRIVSAPKQSQAIAASLPKPWERGSTIGVNLTLWQHLPQGQRDLLLLRTVAWSLSVQWLKPNWSTAMVGVGAIGAVVEGVQGDAAGLLLFSGLSIMGLRQFWRSLHSIDTEKAADAAGVRTATRRGYSAADAARHLIEAINALPDVEGRTSGTDELVRCQALKPVAQPGVGRA